jgi:hypothetical protein
LPFSASTLAELKDYWPFLRDAVQTSREAPLSRRKAMRAVVLIDGLLDKISESGAVGDDLPEARRAIAAKWPSLAVIMDLAGVERDGPSLVVMEQEVPLKRYQDLAVEDFMVSLYNNHCVQRLVVIGAAMAPIPMEHLLDKALEELTILGSGA